MKNKYWIIGIAVIITALILWYVFKKKPDSNTIIRTNKGIDVNYPNPNNNVTNTGFPIVWMVYNANLKKLQSVLGVTPDGIMGNDTINAIRKYVPNADNSYEISNATELAQLMALVTNKNISNGKPNLTDPNQLIKEIYNQSVNSGLVNPKDLVNQGVGYIKGFFGNNGGDEGGDIPGAGWNSEPIVGVEPYDYTPENYIPEDYVPNEELVINSDPSNGENDWNFDDEA